MKKARVVEVPLDRPLTMKEYLDLSKHAYNSSVWTLGRWQQSERQVRQKLQRKGYVDHPVEVDYLGTGIDDDISTVKNIHIIDEVIEKLVLEGYLDDSSMAQSIVEGELRRGKGEVMIRKKLMQKGIRQEDIQDALDSSQSPEDVVYAIQKSAEQYMRSTAYRKEQDDFMKKQKVMKRLLTRGFSMSDINQYFDDVYSYIDVE